LGDPRPRDFDRPLNRARAKGRAVDGQAYRPILRRSWSALGPHSGIACGAGGRNHRIGRAGAGYGHALPVKWDRRIYLASSASLLDVLRDQADDIESVLLVGHNPGLEDLIFDLVPDDGSSPLARCGRTEIPTSAFAVMEVDVDSWKDIEEGQARLVHLMRPAIWTPPWGGANSGQRRGQLRAQGDQVGKQLSH
jgi:phosphohistidine phosphatase